MLQIPTPQPPENEEQPIPITQETRNFCPISLRDWLELCPKANVPHVPAERLTTMNRLDWLMFDTPGDHHDRLKAALKSITGNLKPRHMLRWDFCAPTEVKLRLSTGQPDFHEEMTLPILDDPRAYTILYEFPREDIPVYQRPWLDAAIADGYPIEYRAYVRDGKLQGISNYYPQRPLPYNQDHIDTVSTYTDRLIESVATPFLWNAYPYRGSFLEEHDPKGIHFTADYILDADNRLLFLEGGPPHEMGAHPCCFEIGNTYGVAMKDQNQPED